jgi:hypothetical protein
VGTTYKNTFPLHMKKHFLLFSALVIGLVASAQDGPSIGIKGGLSTAWLKGDAVSSLQNIIDYADGAITTSNRTGFYGGGSVAIPLGSGISVEPGVYYAQKGYTLNGDLNIKGAEFIGANAKAQLTSHYVDLPLLLKANVGGLEVFAGPQVSYLAKSDLKTTAGILGFNVLNRTMDATEQFNRWDAGVTGGVGYQFANGLNISAAYDHGLSKVDANERFDSYNRSFKVGLGFRF